MAGLTNKTISGSFKSLLRVANDTVGVSTSSQITTDGEGTYTSFWISSNAVRIIPQVSNTIGTFQVFDLAGDDILSVDTTNSVVKVNAGQEIANTQYAYFGINYIDFSNTADDTHYPIPFSAASGGGSTTNDVDFGTGTDPDTSFTTANTDTQYAGQIVPMMWYVQDDITIDAITSIQGSDASSGDVTRMHLMYFTLNSGSTSCLAGGTVIAVTADQTDAGNEQAYKQAWTVDSTYEDVDSGKVILAFFRRDTENSDYSLNITVKYHLR